MQKVYAAIALFTFLIVSCPARPDESLSPEQKFVEIRKLCIHHAKPSAVCTCLVKNLRSKLNGGQFSDQQLSDAVKVSANPQGTDSSLDYMADLMTGIEFHCMENSNYSDN